MRIYGELTKHGDAYLSFTEEKKLLFTEGVNFQGNYNTSIFPHCFNVSGCFIGDFLHLLSIPYLHIFLKQACGLFIYQTIHKYYSNYQNTPLKIELFACKQCGQVGINGVVSALYLEANNHWPLLLCPSVCSCSSLHHFTSLMRLMLLWTPRMPN